MNLGRIGWFVFWFGDYFGVVFVLWGRCYRVLGAEESFFFMFVFYFEGRVGVGEGLVGRVFILGV